MPYTVLTMHSWWQWSYIFSFTMRSPPWRNSEQNKPSHVTHLYIPQSWTFYMNNWTFIVIIISSNMYTTVYSTVSVCIHRESRQHSLRDCMGSQDSQCCGSRSRRSEPSCHHPSPPPSHSLNIFTPPPSSLVTQLSSLIPCPSYLTRTPDLKSNDRSIVLQ